MYLNNTP